MILGERRGSFTIDLTHLQQLAPTIQLTVCHFCCIFTIKPQQTFLAWLTVNPSTHLSVFCYSSASAERCPSDLRSLCQAGRNMAAAVWLCLSSLVALQPCSIVLQLMWARLQDRLRLCTWPGMCSAHFTPHKNEGNRRQMVVATKPHKHSL